MKLHSTALATVSRLLGKRHMTRIDKDFYPTPHSSKMTHDSFLILLTVQQILAKNQTASKNDIKNQIADRLDGTFCDCFQICVDSGLLEVQKGLVSWKAYSIEVFDKTKASHTQKTHLLKVGKLTNEKLSEGGKLTSTVNNKKVTDLVRRTTDSRNFNPQYQAVIAGKKARKDPLQVFANGLSRSNQTDFWKEVMEMTDEEKKNLTIRISRFVANSG